MHKMTYLNHNSAEMQKRRAQKPHQAFFLHTTDTGTGIQKDAQFIFLYLLQIRTDDMVFRNYILNIYDKSSQQSFYCTFSSFRIFCQVLSLGLLQLFMLKVSQVAFEQHCTTSNSTNSFLWIIVEANMFKSLLRLWRENLVKKCSCTRDQKYV